MKKRLSRRDTSSTWLHKIVDLNRQGAPLGVFSVCSAHPNVLRAAMSQALDDESILCVESTSNQVNQSGGYSGFTPTMFASQVYAIARDVGLKRERILLGGDHLGPYPWRDQLSRAAMENACELVRSCVLAGYTKIHLDTSMPCIDDGNMKLDGEIVARRTALLCRVAENAWAELPPASPTLAYVIGTEVPLPGGEQEVVNELRVTNVADMRDTLEIYRAVFQSDGLDSPWQRIVGLVVQPGVEFGDTTVFEYERHKAKDLSENLPASPSLVYEAHSTDYQTPVALRQMVEDHFGILKVGPWLTFAFREAVFALSAIEQEWLIHRRGLRMSQVAQALEQAMLRNPAHWNAYYSGNNEELAFARRYSYSDRCRYYWPDPLVQKEMELLLSNLGTSEIPLVLLSQYMPQQYETVRSGAISAAPNILIEDRIKHVLRVYSAACSGGKL